MQYISHYESPLGAITLAADEKGLTGLWFDREKYFGNTLEAEYEEKETVILKKAEKWLDTYFMGMQVVPLVMYAWVTYYASKQLRRFKAA